VGTEPVDPGIVDFRGQIADFCREIETYLCKKNDGHLIRVVGPSFTIVSGWAERGIPLKIAFEGIDRYFERYYRNGPRRRPVKIDFCDADVVDVFEEWRRAVGADRTREPSAASRQSSAGRHSLPEHLERVVVRLTSARATGALGPEFDALIDRAASELDGARAKPGGLRGAVRSEAIERLARIDREMLDKARSTLDAGALADLAREADRELAPFRAGMTADAYTRAREAAVDRLVRTRFNFPTVTFAD
jgi:hypothetical protein